jgi:hypothetical protein
MLLALDLGTACGWALFTDAGKRLTSGVWLLDRADRNRFNVLRGKVEMTVVAYKIKHIAYEHAARHAGNDAAHVFGGYLAQLKEVVHGTSITLVPLRPQDVQAASGATIDRTRGPKTMEKAAKAKAKAARRKNNKAAVLAAARARWGDEIKGEDEADACFVGMAVLAGGTGA